MPDGTKKGGRLSRRKMLALTLSGTAATVAGCQGDTGGDGTTTAGTSTSTSAPSETTTETGTTETEAETTTTESELAPEDMADSVIDGTVAYVPQDMNWFLYAPGDLIAFWLWDYTSRTYWNDYADYWLLQEDGYSYDPDSRTATYNLKEEYSHWWNGDYVTGEDWLIQNEIPRLLDPEGSQYESWEMEDDYTVTVTRKNDLNPVLLGNGGGRIMQYRGVYREWMETLQEATSQSERESIREEMRGVQISTEEFANQGYGNGVYKPVDWNTQSMTFEVHDQHPDADKVPFPESKWHVAGGDAAKNQMINNDVLDFNPGRFPQNLRQTAPEHLQTVYEKKSIQSRNLLFNYNNKHIGRRNVRRALVSVLDFTTLKNYWNGQGGFTKEFQTGLPKSLEDKWLGSEFMNQVYEYSVGSDEEQADQFMDAAGYTREGGTWVGPDGDPLEFTLAIGTYGTQEALGKAMNQSWTQWGAQSELYAQSNSQWATNISQVNDWDVTIWLHGFDTLNPMNFYDYVNQYHMRIANNRSDARTWLDEGRTNSPLNGRPITLTIPSQPGLEVEGEGQQINIVDLVDELQVTQSEERTREIVRTLARYFNYDLPIFDMFPQIAATWGDTRDFSWPDDANLWYQKGSRGAYATWRKGLVDPVEQQE